VDDTIEYAFESDNFKLISATRPNPTGPVPFKFTRPFPGDREITIECQYTFDPASSGCPFDGRVGHDPEVTRRNA